MVETYALIDAAGVLITTCSWDGVTPWEPPDGLTPIRGEPPVAPTGTVAVWKGAAWGFQRAPDAQVMAEAAVQRRIDALAQSWGYDDARSACTYVGDPFARFDAEGRAIRDWRSACWVAAAVAASDPAVLSIDDLLAQLPALPQRPTT